MISGQEIVVWSGGYDSTLVLDQLCSANPKKSIWAYSIEWDMIARLKTKKEKEVRKNYLKYAKTRGYTIFHRTIRIKANMGVEHLGYAQGLAWLSFGIPYLPKDSILYFGYYNDDAFWKHLDNITAYVAAAAKISNRSISLKYPLQYLNKCDILRELEEQGVPQSCVWTCENPSGKKIIQSCGKCLPCINLSTAEYKRKMQKQLSD